MNIIGPDLQRADECEAVLRSLPRWFGIEHALLMYARDAALMPTFYARRGFTPIEIFPTLWDARNPALQCMKVLHGG